MHLQHPAASLQTRSDLSRIAVPRAEYHRLLRDAREFRLLKTALVQGGLSPDALQLLISEPGHGQSSQDRSTRQISDDNDGLNPGYGGPTTSCSDGSISCWMPSTSLVGQAHPSYQLSSQPHICDPVELHHIRNSAVAPSPVLEKSGFGHEDSTVNGSSTSIGAPVRQDGRSLQTLYFVGFHTSTTYRDLISVIKGGKILSVHLRSGKSATVAFLDGAADYLAWVKRNDIYLKGRRIGVRWADRQFLLNKHISTRMASGATRNILIRNAEEQGLLEAQIREDMEHIHGLVIIAVSFCFGHAYVSTNSVQNALFARTCMMSRSTYRGCNIDFFPDECDVSLPVRSPTMPQWPTKEKARLTNRFDMLHLDSDDSEYHEDRAPSEDHLDDSGEEDDDGNSDLINTRSRQHICLDLLHDIHGQSHS